jgi:hypothetical protein
VIAKFDLVGQLLLRTTRLGSIRGTWASGTRAGGVPVLGYLMGLGLMGVGLKGVGLVVGVILVLGLMALIRCRQEDIPAIVQALASWWRR